MINSEEEEKKVDSDFEVCTGLLIGKIGMGSYNNKSAKIAAFDMDYTLIKTKSGALFAKNCFDWQILYNQVPQKLQNLAA